MESRHSLTYHSFPREPWLKREKTGRRTAPSNAHGPPTKGALSPNNRHRHRETPPTPACETADGEENQNSQKYSHVSEQAGNTLKTSEQLWNSINQKLLFYNYLSKAVDNEVSLQMKLHFNVTRPRITIKFSKYNNSGNHITLSTPTSTAISLRKSRITGYRFRDVKNLYAKTKRALDRQISRDIRTYVRRTTKWNRK